MCRVTRLVVLFATVLALSSCASELVVDPALAASIVEIGSATTGQLDMSEDQWVSIAREACEKEAHLDETVAESLARRRGVVFIGTDQPVTETVQVLGAAVCAVNET